MKQVCIYLTFVLLAKLSLSNLIFEHQKEKIPLEQPKDQKLHNYEKTYVTYLTMPELSHYVNRFGEREETVADTGVNLDTSPDSSTFENSEPEKILPNVVLNDDKQLNPGMFLRFNTEMLNKLPNIAVKMISDQFEDFSVPLKIENTMIDIWDINLKLDRFKEDKMSYKLIPSKNAVEITIKNLVGTLNMKSKVHAMLLKSTGTIKVKGGITKMKLLITFIRENNKLLTKPRIKAKLTYLDIPGEDFLIDIHFTGMVNYLVNEVKNYIRGPMIAIFRSFAADFSQKAGTIQANQMFQDKYPVELEVGKLTVGTLMTQKVIIEKSSVVLYIDGMSYIKGNQPAERRSVSTMELNPTHWRSIKMGITQEVQDSFFKNYVQAEFNNEFKWNLHTLTLSVKTEVPPDTITVNISGILVNRLLVNLEINFLGYFIKMFFHLDMALVVDSVDFQTNKMKFTVDRLEMNDYSFNSNIPIIKNQGEFLKTFISLFQMNYKNYTVKIPHNTLPFGLTIMDSKFILLPKYIEMNFDLETPK